MQNSTRQNLIGIGVVSTMSAILVGAGLAVRGMDAPLDYDYQPVTFEEFERQHFWSSITNEEHRFEPITPEIAKHYRGKLEAIIAQGVVRHTYADERTDIVYVIPGPTWCAATPADHLAALQAALYVHDRAWSVSRTPAQMYLYTESGEASYYPENDHCAHAPN